MVSVASCCGHNHVTVFCPHCGNQLQAVETLQGLLLHCRTQAEIQKKSFEKMELRIARIKKERPEELLHARTVRTIRNRERNAAKWAAWRDQLEALLKESSDDGTS